MILDVEQEGMKAEFHTINKSIYDSSSDAQYELGDNAYVDTVKDKILLYPNIYIEDGSDLINYVALGNVWNVVGAKNIDFSNLDDATIQSELTRVTTLAQLAHLVGVYNTVEDVKSGSWEDITTDKPGMLASYIMQSYFDPAAVSSAYGAISTTDIPAIKQKPAYGGEGVAPITVFETTMRLVRSTMFT